MQCFTNHYPDIHPGYPIGDLAPLDKILFIDIETTGLSREHTDLYLIGCGCFDEDGYHTIQWFADSKSDEALLIVRFCDYIKDRFKLLIHYNGNHFDIPYLRFKAAKHNLPDPFEGLESYDIYSEIKPYKCMLGLSSLRQREIEQLLDINSADPYTGRELINVYHRYVKSPSKELLSPLIFHNSEDLKGMAYILPILHYTGIAGLKLEYISHEINVFEDYSRTECRELLIRCRHNLYIPVSFKTNKGQLLISVRSDKTALLRLPVFNGTLKLFYENYRDYYYLPYEDCCVYKAAASGVDPARRENAKKETCYTKHTGLFFPRIASGNGHNTPVLFRESYGSTEYYIAYKEDSAADIIKQQIEDFVL
jgi:hypothetical protein